MDRGSACSINLTSGTYSVSRKKSAGLLASLPVVYSRPEEENLQHRGLRQKVSK
jgi:hypothetical protein